MNCSLCLRVNCGEKVNSQKTRCGTHILQQRLYTLVLWCDIALPYITAVVVFGVSKYTTAIQIMRIGEVSCLHCLKSNFWWRAIHISIPQQPPVGQGLPIIVASRSHSDTPHSVGLFGTSEQPDTEISTCQHSTLTRDKASMLPAGFEPAIPASK
jgi:hypothetical protein